MKTKRYSELKNIETFEDRFEYLKLKGEVGDQTFGGHRYLNQLLYNSDEWKKVRREVIIRDDGCDLGDSDHEISGSILIHHINPITIDDIVNRSPKVFDLDNLICTSHSTHNAIHYGDESLLKKKPINRTKNDTCPWR